MEVIYVSQKHHLSHIGYASAINITVDKRSVIAVRMNNSYYYDYGD